MNTKKLIILIIAAFIGWACCTAAMVIPMVLISVETALIIHAIGAPIIYMVISLVYFSKFDHFTPLQTALFFVCFVIVVDFFVVALLVNRSLEMFTSPLGTWIPFALIFLTTYVTGTLIIRGSKGEDADLVGQLSE